MAESQKATPATLTAQSGPAQSKSLVKCGFALPGYDVEVRGDGGRPLPERHVGTLFVRGPSVMSGYFGEEALTREVLSPEGWLNTGDLAYVVDGSIVITGRQKDLIIINGRNIWPQDLEYIAESQPEVRTGDASAFSVPAPDGEDKAVLVIECRDSNETKRDELVPASRPLSATTWGSTVSSNWFRATRCRAPPPESFPGRGPRRISCSAWRTARPNSPARFRHIRLAAQGLVNRIPWVLRPRHDEPFSHRPSE